MNNLLPVFIKLEEAPCLVVGGGKIALQKIQKAISGKYPDRQFEFGDFSDENERLAFTVNFSNDIDILEEN